MSVIYQDENLHIVLRIGSYQDKKLGANIINAHNNIVQKYQKALFGKAGRGMVEKKLQIMKKN